MANEGSAHKDKDSRQASQEGGRGEAEGESHLSRRELLLLLLQGGWRLRAPLVYKAFPF